MFKFNSEDSESGKRRKERFYIEMIIYASERFQHTKDVLNYCNLTRKTFVKYLRNHRELYKYKYRYIQPERELTRYDKEYLWITKS